MWPARLHLCTLTLHSINLPPFPTYRFKKGGGEGWAEVGMMGVWGAGGGAVGGLTCQECLGRSCENSQAEEGSGAVCGCSLRGGEGCE